MRGYLQCLSYLFQVINADVQDASFNLRDIDIRHSAFETQRFLAEIKFFSIMSDVLPERFSQVCFHLQILEQNQRKGLTLNGRALQPSSYISKSFSQDKEIL
jgi:hypothetical protein